jgi:O-antigen/teichoic acid export membrane protein
LSLFASLARHTRNYSLASVLTTVAGLISFPILTRVLEVQDYGVMNLVASALAFAVGLGKLGMAHATLRFHADVSAGRVAGVDLRQFVPTVLFGMAGLGLLATLGWGLVALLVPAGLWSDPRMAGLMGLTAVLVLVRVLHSGLTNILRAREHSGLLALLTVLHRYLTLGLVLGAVFLIAPTLWSFYGATVLAELALLVALLVFGLRGEALRPALVSPALLRSMIVFALPMTGYELASVVLQLGDRYVQQAYLNAEAVGLYSAAYNLCDYIRLALFTAMTGAALPMLLRLASEQGEAACTAFLARFTHLYVFAGLAVVAGLCAVRVELLSLLASPKYQAGAQAIPWLICGMLCEAYFGLAGIGLYLRKKSLATMSILAGGAALNMLLNVLLVPHLGITGSAISNLLSCAAIVATAQAATRRSLPLSLPLLPLLRFAVLAALSVLLGLQLDFGSPLVTLLLRGSAVVLLYVGLALLLDARLREAAGQAAAGLRARLPGGAAAR